MAVQELFREDGYLRACEAVVTAVHDDGVEFDRTVFYPTAGGQPGDSGRLRGAFGEVAVTDTCKAADPAIVTSAGGDFEPSPAVSHP